MWAQRASLVLIVEPHFEQTAGHSIRYLKVLIKAFSAGGAEMRNTSSRRLSAIRIDARIRQVFDRPIYRK